jgi:DNA invertase Pin-like site-specific DNA recombinase
MKTAILYSRIATCAQEEGGSSITNQLNNMISFCQSNSIEVKCIFMDNATGNSFNRPAYQDMKQYAKKNRKSIDYILVAHWESFARDVRSALIELEAFEILGIEVNCTSCWHKSKSNMHKGLNFIKHDFGKLSGKEIRSMRIKAALALRAKLKK